MEALKSALRWALARAAEPSTWASISAAAAAVVPVAEAYSQGGRAAAAGAAVSAVLGVVLKEKARG